MKLYPFYEHTTKTTKCVLTSEFDPFTSVTLIGGNSLPGGKSVTKFTFRACVYDKKIDI